MLDHTKLKKFFQKDRFAAFIGIKLIDVEPGYAKAILEISENHLNGEGIVHGGAMFTLADFTLAAAANSYGPVALSINAHISYFRPPKGKILTAEAKEVSLSHKLANYNVDVWDEEQEVARFVGTAYRKKEQIKLD